MRRILILLLITTSSRGAMAQYQLYEGGIGQLSVGAQVQTALFGDINNQAGGSAKAHLSDYFWEFSAKPRLDGVLNLMQSSQLYGGFSYVYIDFQINNFQALNQKIRLKRQNFPAFFA